MKPKKIHDKKFNRQYENIRSDEYLVRDVHITVLLVQDDKNDSSVKSLKQEPKTIYLY